MSVQSYECMKILMRTLHFFLPTFISLLTDSPCITGIMFLSDTGNL